ncbi:MAG: substrate-binding domain-containing protein [Phycisphaeraceae bacterium]
MRITLTILSLLISVLIGLVIARGGVPGIVEPVGGPISAARGAQAPLIGLSLDTLKEERWQADSKLFSKRCQELGAMVRVQAANGDDTQQARDVQALLTAGVDVLVIVPHDGVAMAKAVAMAHEKGVPVIAYDRIIRDCDLDLYLSFDNVRVGQLQARYLVDHLPTPGKGRIVRIYGAPTDHNAKLFKEGQDQVLEPYIKSGDIVVLHEDWAEDWKPENAKRITNAAIVNHGRTFDAVLASNDGTAGGAIQALSEEGLSGKVLVTGQDAELAACQRIVAGAQAMTIYKPLEQLASAAAELAVHLAAGKPVIANQSVPNGKIDVPAVLRDVVVVTRDNMVQTVIADGFQSYDDVYRGVPIEQRPPRPEQK